MYNIFSIRVCVIQMFRDFDYENKPVVDIVNEMIIDAINKKASDIHLTQRKMNLMSALESMGNF